MIKQVKPTQETLKHIELQNLMFNVTKDELDQLTKEELVEIAYRLFHPMQLSNELPVHENQPLPTYTYD